MKTEKEIIDKGTEIIDSLEDFNHAEKYRVLNSLLITLKETIEAEGGEIIYDGVKQRTKNIIMGVIKTEPLLLII